MEWENVRIDNSLGQMNLNLRGRGVDKFILRFGMIVIYKVVTGCVLVNGNFCLLASEVMTSFAIFSKKHGF